MVRFTRVPENVYSLQFFPCRIKGLSVSKGGGAWPARRGGDFRSHRKPAGAALPPAYYLRKPAAAPQKKKENPETCLPVGP
jgi:hypothetical protein